MKKRSPIWIPPDFLVLCLITGILLLIGVVS